MEQKETTQFSFKLQSTEHGIGVFATHDIEKGTYLRLFGNPEDITNTGYELDYESVPDSLRHFCIERENRLIGPADFGVLAVGWFLNHSKSNANAHVGEPRGIRTYSWYASRDIKSGEEILIDYNNLEEPENKKADYYNN